MKSASIRGEQCYEAELDNLRERLGRAEALLDEAARAGNLTPGGWLQLQLEIVRFLTPILQEGHNDGTT